MDLPLLIAGDDVAPDGRRRFDVCNPARPSEVVGTAIDGTTDDVDRAVAAAQRAFPAWRDTPVHDRAAALVQAAERLESATAELAPLLTREMGKVISEAFFDVAYAHVFLNYAAGKAESVCAPSYIHNDDYGRVEVLRQPRGVVGAITPWNWPVALLFIKIGQALATGNTIVAVPSPLAPLAACRAVREVAQCLPPGVVNVVTGQGPTVGRALASHPLIRTVSFTGGISTGQDVMRSASSHLAKLTLELGGNDPAILLDDVVVTDELARQLVEGALTTSGQLCFAIKRIYAHERIFDSVHDAIVDTVSQVLVGNGLGEGVTMGPLVSRPQSQRFQAMLDQAAALGANVSTYGRLETDDAEGFFHLPSVVTNAPDDSDIVADEQFGPALPLIPYATIDEVVHRSNATEFGLKSSVWSADEERAMNVARRIEAGTTFINQHSALAVEIDAPLGGFKRSGIGRENGSEGFAEYLELHQINSRTPPPPQ
jgi:aldehyde dehydrogenase